LQESSPSPQYNYFKGVTYSLLLLLLPLSLSLPDVGCWKEKLILAPLFKSQVEPVVDKELINLSKVNTTKAVEEKRDDRIF